MDLMKILSKRDAIELLELISRGLACWRAGTRRTVLFVGNRFSVQGETLTAYEMEHPDGDFP
jgi:hypothetical protein